MLWLALIILLSFTFYGYGAALPAIFAVSTLVLGSVAPAGISTESWLVILLLTLSLPLSAFVSGLLLDSFAFSVPKTRVFSLLGISLTALIAFETEGFVSCLESALIISRRGADLGLIPFITTLGTSVFFSASAVALVLGMLWALFEISSAWLMRAFGVEPALQPDLSGLRPLFLLALAGVLFQHIAALFVSTLWPGAIAGALI